MKARVYTIHLVARGPGGVAVAALTRVTVAAAPGPIIESFAASSTGLPNAGGSISLTAQVANATSCSLTLSPALTGFGGDVPCSSGSITVPVVLPASTLSTPVAYLFTLTISGDLGTSSKALTVTVYPTSTVPTTTTTTPPTTTTSHPVTTGNTISVPAGPDAFVQAGSEIWVASCQGNAVTEINKNTKQIIRTLTNTTNPSYAFSCPDALAFDGENIWVANIQGNSLTQFNALTGTWVRTITGSNIQAPDALVVVGSNVWVANRSTGANVAFLAEFSTNSGTIERTKMGTQPGGWMFVSPVSLASSGSNVWVADGADNSIAEFSGTTGDFIRTTSGGRSLVGPSSVSTHGEYMWASDIGGSRVDEYSAATGVYLRSIVNVSAPNQVLFTGSYLFLISYGSSGYIQQYNSDGILIRNIVKFNSSPKEINTILFDGNSLWTANFSSNSVTVHSL
jgi:hypothetical protein